MSSSARERNSSDNYLHGGMVTPPSPVVPQAMFSFSPTLSGSSYTDNNFPGEEIVYGVGHRNDRLNHGPTATRELFPGNTLESDPCKQSNRTTFAASSVIDFLLRSELGKGLLVRDPLRYEMFIAEEDGQPDLDFPELDVSGDITSLGVDTLVLCLREQPARRVVLISLAVDATRSRRRERRGGGEDPGLKLEVTFFAGTDRRVGGGTPSSHHHLLLTQEMVEDHIWRGSGSQSPHGDVHRHRSRSGHLRNALRAIRDYLPTSRRHRTDRTSSSSRSTSNSSGGGGEADIVDLWRRVEICAFQDTGPLTRRETLGMSGDDGAMGLVAPLQELRKVTEYPVRNLNTGETFCLGESASHVPPPIHPANLVVPPTFDPTSRVHQT